MQLSARNQLKGKIIDIKKVQFQREVVIDINGLNIVS